MLFGKKDHLVGLDIGSGAIKICEIIGEKPNYVLNKFGLMEIPNGLIEEGNIKDVGEVSTIIKQLLSKYGVKENNVAMAIGGYSVIVKKITVQAMEDDLLHENINYEAEQYIPFDIKDVNIDFQILGENETNPNQMNVLLVAAKKDLINDYIAAAKGAGLNPCIMDVDAFALQNIYETSYEAGEEVVALIDIGTSKTTLNIVKQESSLFMRDVSLGCGQINQKIMSMADCTFEEAEKIKEGERNQNVSENDLRGIITSVVADWSSEIRRALDFFYSTYTDDQMDKIILSGGGANVSVLQTMLESETGVSVEIVKPFANIEVDQSVFDADELEKAMPQAAICAGLALRKIGDK